MHKRIIKNGKIYGPDGTFSSGTLYICDGKIVSEQTFLAAPTEDLGDCSVLDAAGCHVIPGLTDLHFHGCMGSDCSDGTVEALRTIAQYELSRGITSITPATMTVPAGQLEAVAKSAADFQCPDGADFLGLYMEGPFISPQKKGAQKAEAIRRPDTGWFRKLQELSGGAFRTVALAPEMEGALDFIRENKKDVRLSIAHTACDYETACQAIAAGASQMTHLYNAMPPLAHRAPGPIAAAADDPNVMAELICDGVHVHPAIVRNTFRMFGEDRILFISDSMRAAGLSDGTYDLGGQQVHVHGPLAALADGTLAGSVSDLMRCLQTAVTEMGISLECAVKCAAVNPIRALGMEEEYGSLEPGKWANLVLLDSRLQPVIVLHRGETVCP